jgi:hypothetical protein
VVPEVIEALDLVNKYNLDMNQLTNDYDAAYNNRPYETNDIGEAIIQKALSLKSHPVTIEMENDEFVCSKEDELSFIAGSLVARNIIKGTFKGFNPHDEVSVGRLGYFNKFGDIMVESLKNKKKPKIKIQ